MTTTKAELKAWFEQGVAQGSAYMIVVCDTFDWEDYPVYLPDIEQAKSAKAMYEKNSSGQRLMEIYNLRHDMHEQLDSARTMAI